MARYIRYKYQKQQINFLNCDNLNEWKDTCNYKLLGFYDVCSSNCNCGEIIEIEPIAQFRYINLNPNYNYYCEDNNRYYKMKKQVSYNDGMTWQDIYPFEYKKGEIYEENSKFCTSDNIITQWFDDDSEPFCDKRKLIQKQIKKISFDNGNSWEDLIWNMPDGTVYKEYKDKILEIYACECGFCGDAHIIFNSGINVRIINDYSLLQSFYNDERDTTTVVEPSIDYRFNFGQGTHNFQFTFNNNITDLSNLFKNIYVLHSLEFYSLDTSKVTDMNSMFYGCNNLISADLSKLNTSNVNYMNDMFTDCGNLSTLNISTFDTSKVINMNNMFKNCSGLTNLNVSSFVTSNVTDMRHMFMHCSGITNLDVTNFDTSKVTNMKGMFLWCKSLKYLNVGNFDTSNVTDMSYMFDWCANLSSLDVSSFDTSQVTNMSNMFYGCSGVTNLDVTNFDTSQVTNMDGMFMKCNNLTSLDLSNFDTSKVTNIINMFAGCTSLTFLDLSNFDISNITDKNYLFHFCDNLKHIKCKQSFKDWCITNQDEIILPTAMRDGGNGTWEIV